MAILVFPPKYFGLSPHSGVAVAMYITGVPDCILVAIVCWYSLWFMVYIKKQISSFGAGVLVSMIHQP